MAKAPTKKAKAKKGFEDTLWDTANQLRGSVESSEYKHVVLSLVFLKFISDKFEARRKQMEDEGQGDFLEMEVFYQQDNIFYLPEEARWSLQDDIAVRIDTALSTIEKRNPSLKGALPDNYFSRQNLETKKLASLIDTIDNIETLAHETDVEALSKEDLVGRVYEYFLGKFAATEGKGGGEFYTPKCVVTLLTEMLEPFQGKIYDPCCGSAGMFVQSVKFVESHQGKSRDIALYGQELTATTYKLAKMNLAIRGLSANLGERPADTFFSDQHPDLKADYILANPPFNLKDWRNDAELTKDPRFAGYRTPPTGNANYGWILHMLSKLSANGTAGFVLANGSMSSNTSGEAEIRAQMIENDLIDCMIALPGQLFFTTQIPVCLWFMTKSKADDIATIADTYHAWRSTPEELVERVKRGDSQLAQYEDQAGFCKVATIAEIKANDSVLTPGRYVGAAEQEDDGVAFETKMRELSQTLFAQMKQAEELDNAIRQNLEVLGYGI
ncbi:TPA: N-6 DNA methylase [Salmonella enterica subsp. enterica]|nr:N-6 DNA methylase [Salmonella enterica subsp. enterica]